MAETMERAAGVIEIPAWIAEAMIAHAVDDLPNEACGLLAGPEGRIEHVYRMHNADESGSTYRLDPREQIRVFNDIDDRGWELAGIYHSHTHTEAYPSQTDRAQAFYPEATYVLLSLQDHARPVIRAFSIEDGAVKEREVRVT